MNEPDILARHKQGNATGSQRFCFTANGYGQPAFFTDQQFVIVVFVGRVRSLVGRECGRVNYDMGEICRATFQNGSLFRSRFLCYRSLRPRIRPGVDGLRPGQVCQ